VVDPLCGSASYDRHKGTDIRLLSLADIEKNISVLATADGMVKAVRDGEPDKLVNTSADREAVKDRECGNGVVIDHGKGIETQYCHMKKDSIVVQKGDKLKTGDVLGAVGASGLAQFPHLHLTLRMNGETIDPFTGKNLGDDCGRDISNSWWNDKALSQSDGDALILRSGLAGTVVNHNELVVAGGPKPASTKDAATVGWAWFANLKKGDQIKMTLTGPNGLSTENTTEPLDRNKASWSGYIGKKRQPVSGSYNFEVQVLRDQKSIRFQKTSFTVD
ncbi:MAG: M23 family metallopeptidase, partial [Salaquimonas sp.]